VSKNDLPALPDGDEEPEGGEISEWCVGLCVEVEEKYLCSKAAVINK